MFTLFIIFPLLALLCDRLLGEAPTRFHPICFAGNIAIKIEHILRKKENGKIMFLRGLFAWFLVLLPCLFVVIFTSALPFLFAFIFSTAYDFAFLISSFIALFWTWVCIAPRSLEEHAKNVARQLEKEDLIRAQEELSMMVGRNTSILDKFAVARACIESVAENLTDGVLASLFWAMFSLLLACILSFLFHSPTLMYFTPLFVVSFITLHRITNILDAMWGKKNEKYINFGTMSAITDDILNFLPARLGLFTVLISSLFIKKAHFPTLLFTALKYRNAHESPNSAWTESAFAVVLNLKFGGLAQYEGIQLNHPIIGEGRTEASADDIYLAIKLMWSSSILFAFFMSFITGISLFFYNSII